MCGITGFFDFVNKSVSSQTIEKMNKQLIHRGPDGEGVWATKNIGLGHRRLSVIDLSDLAAQPMKSKDERYLLTYNGEVYNYLTLRKELERLGYKFYSNSDTEVVLNALIHWGEKAITKFNGMFAFAFYDRADNTLLLARDRYGIKPLYYSHSHSKLIFASEQKAISCVLESSQKLDHHGLVEYLTFQNIFTDRTLNNEIRLLQPGHFLKADGSTGGIKKTKYWDFNFGEKVLGTNFEIQEELTRLFDQAVRRQLASDVEIGSYLSGGMDSGSIASIAARENPALKTFTCGFDLSSASGLELAFDERSQAEAISAFIKSEQYEMVLKSGDMERCFVELVRAIEEPRVGQSYPNFYAAKLASKFVKVVLSGAGGDELFAGYPWRYFRAVGCENFDQYVDEYFAYWQRLLSRNELARLCSPIRSEIETIDSKKIFKSVLDSRDLNNFSDKEAINTSLYFEAKTFLHGLLVVEDKLSMFHSLETRLPFLDNELVDFASNISIVQKISNLNEFNSINENDLSQKRLEFQKKTNDGKKVLRKAMRNYLPEKVINEIKKGFSGPDGSWFQGESIDFVTRSLKNKSAPLYEIFDYKFANQLIDEHLEGKNNRRLLIWSFLSLNQYMSENF